MLLVQRVLAHAPRGLLALVGGSRRRPAASTVAMTPAGAAAVVLPSSAEIEAAAAAYDEAAEQARGADRAKRRAKKVLDRLPAGCYGRWIVRRIPSGRQTVDLDAVRAIFETHGLGEVPMREAAPSLRVECAAAAYDKTPAAA